MRGQNAREIKKQKSPERRERFLRDAREAAKKTPERPGQSYEPKRLSIQEWAEHVAEAYTKNRHIDITVDGRLRRLPITRRSIRPKELVRIWADQSGHCWLTEKKLGLYELEDASMPGAAMIDYRRRSDGYTNGNMRIAASNVAMARAFRSGQWFRGADLSAIDYHAASIHELSGPVLCHITEGLSKNHRLRKLPLTIRLDWHQGIVISLCDFDFGGFKLCERHLFTVVVRGYEVIICREYAWVTGTSFDLRDPKFGHEDIAGVVYSAAMRNLTRN